MMWKRFIQNIKDFIMSNGKPSKDDKNGRHPHGGPPGKQPGSDTVDPDPVDPDPIEPEDSREPDPDPDPDGEYEYGQVSETRSFTTQ